MEQVQLKNPNKNALALPTKFNHCLLRVENGVFVYSADKIIKTLIEETRNAIKKGELDLYTDETDLEESAYLYAVEMFEHNFENSQGDHYPIYEYNEPYTGE